MIQFIEVQLATIVITVMVHWENQQENIKIQRCDKTTIEE